MFAQPPLLKRVFIAGLIGGGIGAVIKGYSGAAVGATVFGLWVARTDIKNALGIPNLFTPPGAGKPLTPIVPLGTNIKPVAGRCPSGLELLNLNICCPGKPCNRLAIKSNSCVPLGTNRQRQAERCA